MGEDLVSGVGGLGVSLWLYRQHRDPTLAKCARVGHPSCPEVEQRGQKPGPPANALAGEWVQVVRLESRLLVYYCTTLLREIDLEGQRATRVARWIPQPEEHLKV